MEEEKRGRWTEGYAEFWINVQLILSGSSTAATITTKIFGMKRGAIGTCRVWRCGLLCVLTAGLVPFTLVSFFCSSLNGGFENFLLLSSVFLFLFVATLINWDVHCRSFFRLEVLCLFCLFLFFFVFPPKSDGIRRGVPSYIIIIAFDGVGGRLRDLLYFV